MRKKMNKMFALKFLPGIYWMSNINDSFTKIYSASMRVIFRKIIRLFEYFPYKNNSLVHLMWKIGIIIVIWKCVFMNMNII